MITKFRGDYAFLSNFYVPAQVTLDGHMYVSVEHAYQAAKTVDEHERRRIREALTPGVAKRMGKKVIMRPDWEEIKETVMLDLCRQKFANNPLRTLLLKTKGQDLVEGNEWGDVFWGVCNGVGENKLGKILMQIRDEIQ